MGDFTPKTPIQLQIRKIIFEKYNHPDTKFTNDEVFEIIQKNGDVDKNWTIDDMEPFFKEICDSGLARSIAQNFTTQWFKIFDPLERQHCPACNAEIYISKSENRNCPSCKAII